MLSTSKNLIDRLKQGDDLKNQSLYIYSTTASFGNFMKFLATLAIVFSAFSLLGCSENNTDHRLVQQLQQQNAQLIQTNEQLQMLLKQQAQAAQYAQQTGVYPVGPMSQAQIATLPGATQTVPTAGHTQTAPQESSGVSTTTAVVGALAAGAIGAAIGNHMAKKDEPTVRPYGYPTTTTTKTNNYVPVDAKTTSSTPPSNTPNKPLIQPLVKTTPSVAPDRNLPQPKPISPLKINPLKATPNEVSKPAPVSVPTPRPASANKLPPTSSYNAPSRSSSSFSFSRSSSNRRR